MAHSIHEGMKGPFHDDPDEFLLEEADHRSRVLAVVHDLIGKPSSKSFNVDYIAIRAGLTPDQVLAVTGTLQNFRQGFTVNGDKTVSFGLNQKLDALGIKVVLSYKMNQ